MLLKHQFQVMPHRITDEPDDGPNNEGEPTHEEI